MWPRMFFLDLQQLDCWLNGCKNFTRLYEKEISPPDQSEHSICYTYYLKLNRTTYTCNTSTRPMVTTTSRGGGGSSAECHMYYMLLIRHLVDMR